MPPVLQLAELEEASHLFGSEDLDMIWAETLFAASIVEHNVPVSYADHFGQLLHQMCPDSKIAV